MIRERAEHFLKTLEAQLRSQSSGTNGIFVEEEKKLLKNEAEKICQFIENHFFDYERGDEFINICSKIDESIYKLIDQKQIPFSPFDFFWFNFIFFTFSLPSRKKIYEDCCSLILKHYKQSNTDDNCIKLLTIYKREIYGSQYKIIFDAIISDYNKHNDRQFAANKFSSQMDIRSFCPDMDVPLQELAEKRLHRALTIEEKDFIEVIEP